MGKRKSASARRRFGTVGRDRGAEVYKRSGSGRPGSGGDSVEGGRSRMERAETSGKRATASSAALRSKSWAGSTAFGAVCSGIAGAKQQQAPSACGCGHASLAGAGVETGGGVGAARCCGQQCLSCGCDSCGRAACRQAQGPCGPAMPAQSARRIPQRSVGFFTVPGLVFAGVRADPLGFGHSPHYSNARAERNILRSDRLRLAVAAGGAKEKRKGNRSAADPPRQAPQCHRERVTGAGQATPRRAYARASSHSPSTRHPHLSQCAVRGGGRRWSERAAKGHPPLRRGTQTPRSRLRARPCRRIFLDDATDLR